MVEPAALDAQQAVVGLAQRALAAEHHVATHIDQVAAGIELRLGGLLRRRAGGDRTHVLVLGFQRREDARQQQVGCRQVDPAIGRGAFAEVQGTAIQAQALAHVQRHIAIEAQQAVAQQCQVVEAAGGDLIHPEAAVAILQAGGRGVGATGQCTALVDLAEHQFPGLEHPVNDRVLDVVRAFQGQRQGAPCSASASGPGDEAAIQVQAVVGREADAATVAGHLHPALAGNVQGRLGAGSIETRPLAHHHKQVAGLGDTGGQVDLAADGDLAAIAHLAVTAATVVHGAHRPRRHINHRLLADPDRASVTGGIGGLGTGHRQAAQTDAAAPGIERAVHGQLADAAQVDGLPRVDTDHRALPHAQRRGSQLGGRGVLVAGAQGQAGATALGQHAPGCILLVQLRQPALQHRGRVAASGTAAGLGPEAVDRHVDLDLGALGHGQPFVAGDVVGTEALVEEIPGQLQGAGLGGRIMGANQHLVRLQGQGAAAVDPIPAQLAIEVELAVGGQGHVAALATAGLAVIGNAGAGAGIHQGAVGQVEVAAAAQRHLAPVDKGQAAAVRGVQGQVVPAPAGIQLDPAGYIDPGLGAAGGREDHIADHEIAVHIHLVQHVAGVDAATVGGEVGVDLDLWPEQGDVAAIGHLQPAVDLDLLPGADLDRPQLEAVELVTVQHQLALAVGRQGCGEVQAVGDLLLVGLDQHLVHAGAQGVAQGAAGLVVDRRVVANDQLRALGRGLVRLLVAVEVDVRRLGLAVALEHFAYQLAFEHGVAGADHQLAGVAADAVAGLVAALLGDQRVVVVIGAAPARAAVHIALVDAGVEQVPRRPGELVQAPVGALEPGLLDVAALHIDGAAGEVQLGAGLGHHVLAGEGQGTALGHPLADVVALGAQVAAHFQQAAGGVPAIGGVAVGACRDEHQLAQVDPDVVVDQLAAVAVARRIALLVALDVDLDVVGLHRHLDPDGAGHIDHRAIAHQAALPGTDRHLATGGQGDGAVLEIHGAAADDLHPGLVAAVGHAAEVVELADDQVGRGAVEVDQAVVALAVQSAAATAVQKDCGGAALPQGHAAGAVAGGVEQMDGAAGVHRSAGQGHAVLRHLVPGEGDVARGGHDQAAVADLAGAAAGLQRSGNFIAPGGGVLVAAGADPAADVEAVAGRQGGLALGSDDGAGVLHFRAQQQGIAAGFGGGGRRVGLDQRAALHLDLAQGIAEGRLGAVGVHIEPALGELLVADGGRGRHQVAHIDLAGAAEDHPVAVHDHHRTGALDLALDFAGPSIGVVDLVQQRPVGLLLEVDGGVAPDVEGLPVENGLVGGLLDGHRGLAAGLALHRPFGIEPTLGQAVVDLQPAFAEAIGNGAHRAECGLACGSLGRLLGGDGGNAGIEVAQGALQLLVGAGLLGQRRDPRNLAVGARGGGGLGRALVGEPAGTEGRGAMGTARHNQQGDGLGQGLEPQDRQLAIRAQRGGFDRWFAANHYYSSFVMTPTGARRL